MKRLLQLGLVMLMAGALVLSVVGNARADTFNPNEIMDDVVFDNSRSMGASQIDTWLNANFPSSCISSNNGFASQDPTGYSPSGGFTYGANVSAGQVIADAGLAYGVNPQAILATIQKEEGLVVGNGPYGCSALAISAAVGYGCPDGGASYSYSGVNLYSSHGTEVTSVSGTCVNSAAKVGFSQQIIHAAWLLKFGEQRSEGNIGWDVQLSNFPQPGDSWNNSDDPETCYGGPMTQGTYQICPSGPSNYYDGYYTIDGTSVHMNTGTTAALYWYTPHFSGNQSFFNIFTAWFGSTTYPQPIGGNLYYQTSTGKVFLVTDSTRYYIPSWGLMTDYGLDAYAPIPATDATIQSFTDGGTLSNLIWDGNGVYLVNNRVRYPVPAAMCTAWGFSCSDNTIVKGLGATFQTQYLQTGWVLAQLNGYGGVIYEMSGGQRLPIANPQTMSDLGLTYTSILNTAPVNATQPLGQLLITTPTVISFPPSSTIYYFNGSNYYGAPSMTSYNDWAFGSQPQTLPPVSSYNTTPPSSTTLTPWYQDGSGNKYIIDEGRRVQIPSSLQSLWSQTFATQPQNLANSLPQTTIQQFIWSNGVYKLTSTGLHYVPTWDDYLALGINSGNTTLLLPDKVSGITRGNDALGDGVVIALQNDNQSIYVINNGQTTHIPDANTFNAYGFDWNNVLVYPSTITNDYPMAASALSSAIANDSTYFAVGNGTLYKMSPAMAADYGAINSHFGSITTQTARKSNAQILSRFMYNTDDGKIYYASGGAVHYVATYSAFVAYGGPSSPIANVNNGTISLFTIGQPVY